MTTDIRTWIIRWFVNNTSVSAGEIDNGVTKNYFEMDWIDSLQFITFIVDIEKTMKISFSSDDFQDRSFSTIEGLSRIIERKKCPDGARLAD